MLGKPTQVRFSADTDRRLSEVADANGMTKVELIRLCVTRTLDKIDEDGGIEIRQQLRSPRPPSKRNTA